MSVEIQPVGHSEFQIFTQEIIGRFLKSTRGLADYFARRPFLVSIKEGRDNFIFVNTQGINGKTQINYSSSTSEDYLILKEEYFRCPKCQGKIESGKGITVCPHCGARKGDVISMSVNLTQ